MEDIPNVSDTAFITGYFRSKNEDRSLDPWSKLWVTDRAKKLGDAFIDQVTPHDPTNIQLRSRYFVEALNRFSKNHEKFCFLNLGAGFTTYPYQSFMIENSISLEVDQEHVVSVKDESSKQFVKSGQLPAGASLHYLGVNFEVDRFEDMITEKIRDLGASSLPRFVLMEGFFYYLKKSTSDRLWSFLLNSVPRGSQIGIIHMPLITKNTSAMRRTRKFLKDLCGYDGEEIVYHEKNYFLDSSLKEIDASSHVELEGRYLKTSSFSNDAIMNEHFLLLEKS